MPSIDPADGFLNLYSELDRKICLNRAATWRADGAFRALARAVRDDAMADRYDGIVGEDAASLAGQRERLAHLTGLDWAFKYVNPILGGMTVPPGLHGARLRYTRDGRLNSDPDAGLLLVKLTLDHRSEELPDRMYDLFSSVVGVEPTAAPRSELILTDRTAQVDVRDRQRGLRIACLPLMEDDSELEFRTRRREDLLRYFMVPSDMPAFSKRIAAVLSAAATDGVQLVAAPELSCTDALLSEWRNELRTGTARGGSVRWALAGSGNVPETDPATNTAVLLGADGMTIVTQDKQFRFDISEDQQRGEYALPGLDGSEKAYEDIDIGYGMSILELGAVRLAILICEDVARVEELLGELYALGVSHVLVPIFSKETRPRYWEDGAAGTYVAAQGATVIVTNSLVLARRNGAAGDVGVALVATPHGTSLQKASSAEDLVRWVIHDGKPPEGLDTPFPRK